MRIRKAELRDVPALFRMINHYAAERVMLPRSIAELYENVWEFTLAEEEGKILACGALRFYSEDIAEIRSLCVESGEKSRGVGRAVTEQLLRESEQHGLKTVFALTLVPDFFLKCGFRAVPRESLPMKIWRDCIHCDKLFNCDEKTVAIDLSPRSTTSQLTAEVTGVTV